MHPPIMDEQYSTLGSARQSRRDLYRRRSPAETTSSGATSDQQNSGLHPVTVVVSSGAENRGAAFARNAAVRQSSGAVLVIQDADDVMHPSRVELQVATLLAKEAEMRQGSGRERQAIMQQNVDEADMASLVLVDHASSADRRRNVALCRMGQRFIAKSAH